MSTLQGDITGFVNAISTILTAIGASVFGIGIMVAGIMRITAFGNETRIARSNQALICAIVGFVIVVAVNVLASALRTSFGG